MFFVSGGVGGAERVTLTIAKLIDREKFDIELVVTDHSLCELSSFIPSDLSVTFLNEKHLRIECFFKIVKVLRNRKPDYTFSSMTFVNILVLVAVLLFSRSVKPIVRAQINPSAWNLLELGPLLAKMLYKFAYKAVAQTPLMKKEMIEILGIPDGKMVQLYNPIDVQNITHKIKESSPFDKQEKYRYVAVGRCASQKGFDLLIKAMKKVIDFNPDSELFIVGSKTDDEYGRLLDRLVIDNGLTKNVYFEGFQTNPYKYLYNSDCFVLSSRDEGLPNVLIESTFLNRQAIAYKCIPIIKEIIQDGTNGLCVERKI